MPATPEALAIALADKYRFEREIGAGGMATVYVAQDLKHDRRVAVKVLRPELAAVIGAERFLAEIKTTAHLQHPHILPLFDSGAADGFLFYVMPFVEGESLRHRLDHHKQLAIPEAVRIATQVANALDYAHRHGVIHRDIKPENILLHDDAALVADFGIALAVTSSSSTRMTETGMSLGTPQYMSPEQAMGEREIGPRCDIYALGAVTYELLVGEPPFTGPTAQAIVAKVVTEDPRPMTPRRHTIPAHVEAAVLTAIQKLPADRFATAADFANALANPGFAGAGARVSGPRSVTRRETARRNLLPFLAGAAVVGLGAAGWLSTHRAVDGPATRYALDFLPGREPNQERGFALSPDGMHLAYIGPVQDGQQIWIKSRHRFDATALAGTVGAGNPTFSPDSRSVVFVQNGQLKRVSILGGTPTILADTVSGLPGPAWLDNGRIAYIPQGATEIRIIPDDGGEFTVAWRTTSGQATQLTPLPGGRGLLFTKCGVTGCILDQELIALDLENGKEHPIEKGVLRGSYLPTGHVIYVRADGTMLARHFDAKRLTARGTAVPLFDSVAVVGGVNPLYSASAVGTLMMRTGGAIVTRPLQELIWIDQRGTVTPFDTTFRFRHTAAGDNAGWRISPDGTRLAIGLATASGDDIWVRRLAGGTLSRATLEPTPDLRPRWAPDGQSLLFGAFVGANVMRQRADGTGSPELVLDLRSFIFEFALSPDGQWLIYRTGGTVQQVGLRDVWARRTSGDTTAVQIAASREFDEAGFDLSPDGKWIAYESNETGRKEVHVRPFPNAASAKWPVSTTGGHSPLWAKHGRELYFIQQKRMHAVSTTADGAQLEFGTPRSLFTITPDIYSAPTDNYAPFDVAADGRFLMARRIASDTNATRAPLLVIENWFGELREKTKSR